METYETGVYNNCVYDGFGRDWIHIRKSEYETPDCKEFEKLVETVQSACQDYLKTIHEKNNGNF